MQALLIPFFGHHGQPVEATQLRLEQFFAKDTHSDDLDAARQFVEEWAGLIDVEWPVEKLVSSEWLVVFLTLSWTIAGWATLSDWLGSNQEHFHYCRKEMPLTEYWQRYALPRAEAALRDTGFDRLPEPLAYSGLEAWFDGGPITPTPLQCSGQVVADTFIKLLPRFSRSPSACGSQGSSGAGSCCTPSRYRSRRRASLTGGSNTAVPPAIRSSESRRSAP